MMKENKDSGVHVVLSVDCVWEDLSALLREGRGARVRTAERRKTGLDGWLPDLNGK
jgi:hypothetical protein